MAAALALTLNYALTLHYYTVRLASGSSNATIHVQQTSGGGGKFQILYITIKSDT